MADPFFSVVIPTCNRNDLLRQCLDRLAPELQKSEGFNYEVIVSDDSPGEGAERMLLQDYPWVQYTRGPQRGPAANRNNGATLAKAPWLVFLDDDCLPERDLLDAYMKAICINPSSRVLEGVILPEGPRPHALVHAPIKTEAGALWSCNFCISSELFKTIGGFDEQFRFAHMEDKDLQVRLERTDHSIFFVPEAKVIHPWRKLASGKELGKREESLYYFYRKHQIPFSLLAYFKKLFFFYFSRINDFKSIPLAFRFGKEFIVHLTTVAFLLPGWKKKYARFTF